MIHKGKKMKQPINKDFIKKFDLFGLAPKWFNCFEKYFTPDMLVLDVGTGRGVATKYLCAMIKRIFN